MVYVDSRIGSKEFYQPLVTALGTKLVTMTELPAADFCWDGNGPTGNVGIGVERKTVDDALHSIRSGRLAQQVADMSKYYKFMYVLVEGIYRANRDGHLEVLRGKEWKVLEHNKTHYMYAELGSALNTFSLHANVIVLRSSSQYETIHIIKDLFHWWQKDWDSHQAHQAIKMKGDVVLGRAGLSRRVASELPGIGWSKSKLVAEKFETWENMAIASVKDWQSIEGIGPKLANKIYNAIRGK